MKFTLQLLTGDKYFLDVEPQNKVREVKRKIFEELEIKEKVHLLWQNKELEDRVTLRAVGITEDATLQMVIQPDTEIKLNIQTFKKGNISVELNDSSTLHDLMMAMSKTTLGTTSKVSDFYFHGVKLHDEELPFHLCGINDGSVLVQYCQEPFTIQVEDAREYKRSLITITGQETVKDLKERVLKSINKSVNRYWNGEWFLTILN